MNNRSSTRMFRSLAKRSSYCIAILLTSIIGATAQEHPMLASSDTIKRMSIEQLMNLEVTSVSRTAEKLSEVASAIQVITSEYIRRSAATSIPEALRLAPNLQVTQATSRQWIISARGFNTTFSNKLLVLIDGRTVYSPLFAGVFWDAQQVLLEDVDRIEVISGPGGTLWGANAVNGVINIITKQARETQGLYVSAGVGSFMDNLAELRYGGKLNEKVNYRVYGSRIQRDNTFLLNGKDNTDQWFMNQGGLNLSWDPSAATRLDIQVNAYAGTEHSLPRRPSSLDGQNIMGTWSHQLKEGSNMIIRGYVDRTWRRDVTGTVNDQMTTYDLDAQHRIALGKRQQLMYGLGYRFVRDQSQNTTTFVGLVPPTRNMQLFSSFIQDEFTLKPNRLKLTVGTKLQHYEFVGFALQPSARFTYTPTSNNTLWAAVSKAVRAPSRLDVDYRIPTFHLPPTAPQVAGGPNFISEKVVAYELGYRMQASNLISLSIAGFYNQYSDLYSVENLPNTQVYQIMNGAEGTSHGLEFSGNLYLSSAWRLRGGYTYFVKNLKYKPNRLSSVRSNLENLGTDAKNQVVLQSIIDLPKHFQLDLVGRYVDYLTGHQFNPAVPPYFNLDSRVSWTFKNALEASVAWQDILNHRHAEVSNIQIPRGVYARLTWRY